MKKVEGNSLAMAVISNQSGVIAEIAKCLDGTCQNNIAMYLLGLINPNDKLPEKAVIYDNEAKLKDYNWLSGVVTYEVERHSVRYFPTVEKAEKAKDRYDGTSNKTEECQIAKEVIWLEKNYTDVVKWNNGAIE